MTTGTDNDTAVPARLRAAAIGAVLGTAMTRGTGIDPGAMEALAEALLHDRGLAELVTDAVIDVIDSDARANMLDHYVRQYAITSMDYRNGVTMDLKPAREMVAHWVAAAVAYLEGAPNYVTVDQDTEDPGITMGVGLAGAGERYSFTLQRVAPGKLTPHEARQRAENRLATVRTMALEHPRSGFARQLLAFLDAA